MPVPWPKPGFTLRLRHGRRIPASVEEAEQAEKDQQKAARDFALHPPSAHLRQDFLPRDFGGCGGGTCQGGWLVAGAVARGV